MKIKPIGKRVLVKAIMMEEKTASGIILPGAENKEVPNTGEIVAISNDAETKVFEVGGRVIFKRFAGTEIESEGQKYTLLDMEDVLAICE